MLQQFLGWGFGVEGVPSSQAYQSRVANDPLVRRASVALVNGQRAFGHDGVMVVIVSIDVLVC